MSTESVTNRGRGELKVYKPFVSFRKREEAEKYVENDVDGTKWYFMKSNRLGTKAYYKCKTGCHKKLYILMSDQNDRATIYISEDEHIHYKVRKLTDKSVNIRGIKDSKETELLDWCEKNSELPSSDDDKPFVVDSYFDINRQTKRFDRINIVISTKRLINLALKRPDILICDSSYKFIWQGYSVIVVGTLDFAKRFHPIAIAINESEKTEDHKFLLDAIRNSIRILHNVEYNPKYYLFDNGDSKGNGFSHVFIEPSKRVFFWSSVISSIDNQLRRIKDKNDRKRIREDIFRIRSSQNELIFAKAVILFDRKWRGKSIDHTIDEFIDYFKRNWCSDRNCGWYEGYSICQPIDDRFKAKNRVMKPNHVNKQMSVSEFLNKIVGEKEGTVKKWSADRNPQNNNITFSETPIFGLVEEIFACRWDQNRKQILSTNLNGIELYFTSADDQSILELNDCLKFISNLITLPFDSLDALLTETKKIHVIRLNRENWKMSSCNCSEYIESYICKHIIAIAVRNSLHEFDPRSKQISPTLKRKRGD